MDSATEELSQLSVNAPSFTGSFSMNKENISAVFVGHVDAGKSTLGGQLLFLTGMVDQRTLDKYERESKEMNRESWYFSWALDTNEEERNKGTTVECGRAFFETENKKVTLIDAPGHKNYVPNMLSGAAQADIAVLVISARKGEFETGFEKGGQTGEHACLVKTAGVRKLAVVVNKMDDPSVQWSEERWTEIKDKLSPFLRQIGFNLKTEVQFIPISGLKGFNIKDPIPQQMCSWYEGPTFLSYINDLPKFERDCTSSLVAPVHSKYKDMGTIIGSKIERGSVRKGDLLILMPNKQEVEVTSILVEEQEVESARCGDNVCIKLKGVEEEEVSNGFVLCEPSNPVNATTTFQAQLSFIDIKNIVAPGFSAVFHLRTTTDEVTIVSLDCIFDKKTKEKSKKKPMFVRQGDMCVATLECSGLVCMEVSADLDKLSRFCLRDEGKTIAIGKVIKVL